MNLHTNALAVVVLIATLIVGCQSTPEKGAAATRLRGTLLLIGGGLDDDHGHVYQRLIELASAHGPARIVVATAATGPQDDEAVDKSEALRAWLPGVHVEVVRRETDTATTVAAIDAATAMIFTGGDQKRITDRYRPGEQQTPEWLAMQRLLQRGGVIAGASAGDAMMGEIMFLTGSSARALGIAARPTPDAQDDAPAVLGPQIGPGMGLQPWLITDSHFFERDRMGRLVAGLEASGRRLGIGVGEDACVELDLATGELIGVTVSESLLVDAANLQRDGLTRRAVSARLIGRGDRVALIEILAARQAAPLPAPPATNVQPVPIVEPGQNRQLASWRLFRHARTPGSGVWRLQLEGWAVVAWAGRGGEIVFDLEVRP